MKNICSILFLLFITVSISAQVHIRYNQAGYYPTKEKRIVVMSESNISGNSWDIKDVFNTVVLTGTVAASVQGATDYTTKAFNYEIDFSSIETPGDYTFNLQGELAIDIKISCSPYESFIFDVLKTIRARRSGSNDAIVHGMSHTGDVSCEIYERIGTNNASWAARGDGKTADMLGGWYDAGDYIKFTLTSAYVTYYILKSYEANPDLFNSVKDYSTTQYCDMLDEAKHGLDFLMKTMPEPGIFIIQTGGHEDHSQGMRMPENDLLDGTRECYSSLSKTQMGYTAAALALGAKVFKEQGYTAQAALYEAKAKEIYAAAKASSTTPAWWEGGSEVYYADNNADDNMELAAIELYRLTATAPYLTDAQAYGAAAGSAGWVSWGNVNMTAHANLIPEYSGITPSLTSDLNAFRNIGNANNNIWRAPHTSTWGTLYSYFGVANGALQYQKATDAITYQNMAVDVLDYTFGINPWGLAFVASEDLPNSITSTYAIMYRLQPGIFPRGEIAEGPTTATTHADNRQWFSPVHDPSLWHSEFNSDQFTFFEQDGDYICMETTIGGLADGLFLFSLASTLVCDNPCPDINFPDQMSLCGNTDITIDSGIPIDNTTTFQWFKGVTEIQVPDVNKNTITIDQADTYRLVIEQAGVCSNSKTIVITNEITMPDLGNTFDLCKPGFKTLKTGITDAGHTFTWKKDGQLLPMYTTDSLLVYNEGSYEVTVSASGCTPKSDIVTVTSSLPEVIHDTLCASGIANLQVNEAGNTLVWFDSPDESNLVHTGNTYSPSISNSQVYYVKDGATSESTVGLTTTTSGWLNPLLVDMYTTTFDALQDITISEVTVFSGSSQTLIITVFESDGVTPVDTYSQSIVAGQNVVSPDLYVPAGYGYILSPIGTTGSLQIDDTDVTYPYTVSGVISLKGITTSWGTEPWYVNFYNIKVLTGNSCGVTPVFATIDPSHFSCGPSQQISLEAGWNLISTNIIPTDARIETLFSGLDVDIIKNAAGFWRQGQPVSFNSLTYITPGEAYLVKMNVAGTLTLTGSETLSGLPTPISGWQMIGCPFQTTTTLDSHFSGVETEVVKDFTGFWEPGGILNSITDLEPGKGYFVKGK